MAEQDVVSQSLYGASSPYPRDASLAELFTAQVAATPTNLAVQQGAESLSYAALEQRAARLAQALMAHGVGVETPVGVMMQAGISHIVTQVAIALVGATCVPLDPEYPCERLALMVEDARVAWIVGERGAALSTFCAMCPAVFVVYEGEQHPEVPRGLAPLVAGAQLRTHILYTSGSTGRPKGIEIIGRAINRLVLASHPVQVKAGDRMAQIASFSFDAALFEVWGALLNGATIVQLPRTCVLDPPALAAALQQERVSCMFLTTALFNLTAQAEPRAFACLRCLIVGGERANLQTMQAVLRAGPPQEFMHAYGPTEATTFTTMHPLTLAEVAGPNVAIGRPIANTRVFILDAEQRPVPVGVPGELYVGGDGLARGYLARPELTRERFVWVDGLDPCAAVRLYRSGDMAQWRRDGAIEFLGRTDFQIKLRGFRIELEEVEAALMASDLLGAAAVTVETDVRGDGALVAHVVPRGRGQPVRAALQQYLRATLPAYMIPARVRECSSLPVNHHGKIDRAALRQVAPEHTATAVISPVDPVTDDLAIAAVWRSLLGVTQLLPEDDFFALGGDSLRAARLMLRVRELSDVALPFNTLYEASTFGAFVARVRELTAAVLPAGRVAVAEKDDGPAAWRRHASLSSEVERLLAARGDTQVTPLAAARTIFMTGATGFLGAFLLRDLLRQTDARVWCLVRAASPELGLRRLRRALDKYGLWEPRFARRIRALPGDLAASRLGLKPQSYAEVATCAEQIFHVGAHVHYVASYAAHRPSNVEGTHEIIRLAALGRAALHHVSTIAVFGPTGYFNGVTDLFEDEPLEPHAECLRYDIGYSASKWVAEQAVWKAARLGLPVSVYRPGFIMGASHSGIGDDDSFMARLLRGCIQLGAYPHLPRQRKEFVTVDYVSAAIAALAAHPEGLGHAYHLVPPTRQQSPDLEQLFALLAACGHPLEVLPYRTWAERLSEDPGVTTNPLCPLIPLLLDAVTQSGQTRWELYQDMPHYRSERACRLLAELGPQFHEMDQSLLARHVEHWQAAGLLAAGRIAGQRPEAAAGKLERRSAAEIRPPEAPRAPHRQVGERTAASASHLGPAKKNAVG